MLWIFLRQDTPSMKKTTLLIPVVGHSFIPPYRIFGHTEAEIKKHTTLFTDQDYIKIFEYHTTVNTWDMTVQYRTGKVLFQKC